MFQENFSLKNISYYKIGGEAKYFYEAKNIDYVIKAVNKAKKIKTPIFILGDATNVLIDDRGFQGLVIKPKFNFIEENNCLIRVDSGTAITDLLDFAYMKKLSGIEWAAGLPGTVGGAVYGNAGAFAKEMKDIVESIVSLDISQKIPKIIKRKTKDCLFDYRSSIFKKNSGKEIILEAVLKMKRGDYKKSKEEIEKNINYRFINQPLEYPSLGSTFKNVPLSQIKKNNKKINIKEIPIKNDSFPLIPAAYLISAVGLKGISCGGAMISSKHPNFIVNVFDATAGDVRNLIELVKNEVKRKFDIALKEEIQYLK